VFEFVAFGIGSGGPLLARNVDLPSGAFFFVNKLLCKGEVVVGLVGFELQNTGCTCEGLELKKIKTK